MPHKEFFFNFRRTIAHCCILLAVVSGSYGDTVAFFYALEADLEKLTATAPVTKNHFVGDRSISQFNFYGHQVYALKMGSGCVTTAVSATSLLSVFQIDHVFSVGPAAGINGELNIGEWYFVESHAPYQSGSYKAGGFVLSEEVVDLTVPVMPKFHSHPATSGERFIASSLERERIATLTGATLLEMNLYGLVNSARSHRVPLICLRVVSDFADDEASAKFAKFVNEYKGNGAMHFLEWLEHLPVNPDSPEAYRNLNVLLEGIELDLSSEIEED